jgi:phosphatidylserine decarboxylase
LRFAKEAWPFVLPFLLVAGALALLGRPGWAALALLLGLLVLLFFRHPTRRYAGAPETVLAAADGLVTLVDRVEDPEVGPGAFHRVVTFLSVFDVHTQRAPVSGEVVVSRHTRGRKVAAFKSGIDLVNERHLTVLRHPQGDLVAVRQIAGLLARRVVCYLQGGQRVERGQTMGLIKFGSRVDLLVPEGYRLLVEKGERLRSGASPVAEPPAGERR